MEKLTEVSLTAFITVVVILAVAVAAFFIINSGRPKWEPVEAVGIKGVLIEGDLTMPRSTRWNVWYLDHFVWDKTVTLEVPKGVKSYRVGFVTEWGHAFLSDKWGSEPRYQMKVGREDVRFFALDPNGKELKLKPVLGKTRLR